MQHSIFGHTWDEIQAMQQKRTRPPILHKENPTATEDDKKLLDSYGLPWLEANQFYGVIDRLTTSGLIKKTA